MGYNTHHVNNQSSEPESMSKASFPEQGERANNEIFETALQWACAEGCVCAFRCQHRSTWYFYTAPPPVNPQPLWNPLLHPPGWSVLLGLIKKNKKTCNDCVSDQRKGKAASLNPA